VRVGALVDGERKLLTINGNSVSIGRDGQPAFTLTLAPLLPAQGVAMPSPQPATYALAAPMAVQQDPGVVPGVMPPATLPPPRPQGGPSAPPNQIPPQQPGPNSLPLR
jgi:hypothetical protein